MLSIQPPARNSTMMNYFVFIMGCVFDGGKDKNGGEGKNGKDNDGNGNDASSVVGKHTPVFI